MVCERIKKIKAAGSTDNKSQRLYIMTFERIYTFKDSVKSREYKIGDVRAIISSSTNESDLYVFFERVEDLHIATNNRLDVINMIKLRFNNINRNITLRHFSVDDSTLQELHRNNTKKEKASGVYDLPDDSYRLLNEEIKGEEEYNAELR